MSSPPQKSPARRSLPALSVALATLLALLGGGASADAPGAPADVLVVLRAPAALSAVPPDRQTLKVQVEELQQRVLNHLPPADFSLRYRYEAMPALAGAASPRALRILQTHPDVVAVWPDIVLSGALSQSVPLINADDVHALGLTGAGTVVAVIDSGIDTDHPGLAGSLVHEECFMAYPLLSSRCPNGQTRQSGPGAAEDDLGHGTNVTGIITGSGTVAPTGVAPGAYIVAIKIIDNSNALGLSDLTAALDHILADHPEVDLINMSLGTFGSFPPGTCESAAAPYNALRAAGALPFAAAMNQGTKNGMGLPACIGSVMSVGAVYDANVGFFGTSVCTDATTAADKVACW
ncbi:MAG TPA: S8 family serine peptidase, partial [Dehalococcoidia bacterium]|nr:S8 family serine peptidase [Dehalococcoidia bacterium]